MSLCIRWTSSKQRRSPTSLYHSAPFNASHTLPYAHSCAHSRVLVHISTVAHAETLRSDHCKLTIAHKEIRACACHLVSSLLDTPEKCRADARCLMFTFSSVPLHCYHTTHCSYHRTGRSLTRYKILTTVLDEVRHRSAALYGRLRKLISAPEAHFYVFANENHRLTFVSFYSDTHHHWRTTCTTR